MIILVLASEAPKLSCESVIRLFKFVRKDLFQEFKPVWIRGTSRRGKIIGYLTKVASLPDGTYPRDFLPGPVPSGVPTFKNFKRKSFKESRFVGVIQTHFYPFLATRNWVYFLFLFLIGFHRFNDAL